MVEPRPARILVVDDDAEIRSVLCITLEEEGYETRACEGVTPALRAFEGGGFDLVLTDLRMPGGDGILLLENVRRRSPGTPVLLMTAFGGIDEAVDAVKAGADDFLQKPILPEILAAKVARSLEAVRLRRRVEELEGERAQGGFVAESPPMKELAARLPVLARSDHTILLRGETGTGKEVVARQLHDLSNRSKGPFTAVNCGGIPEDLFEAELFGHARGAFTGADRDRPGLIAETDGGTLFLDEVGDLPYPMQVKILRILEDGEVRQIGRGRASKVDVRVVAATNADLEKAVAGRTFRQDLYYRLNTIEVFLAPLRERLADIPVLADRFLAEVARKQGRPQQKLGEDALRSCLAHPWPGNVRELRNRIRAASLFAGPVIESADLQLSTTRESDPAGVPETPAPDVDGRDLRSARQRFEKQFIEEALRRCRGNVFKAAGETGISRRQLYDQMKALGIDPAAFRDSASP